MEDGQSLEADLFGSLFVFLQQLTLRAEEHLAQFGLTSRQWLLLGVIEKAFAGRAPTISEATAVFGTSRQNVKQVAQQLQHGGWLRLESDPADARVLRLVLTERIAVFHDPAVQADQADFLHALFEGLTQPERRAFLDLVTRCIRNLRPERTFREQRR